MKKIFIITFLLTLFFSPLCLAQEKAKFGKISPEELKMAYYEKDSTASAVVLYEEMEARYEYDQNSLFKVVSRYFVRIKILTNEGLDLANQSISRYIGNSNMESESLSGLSGNSYNLVNGSVETVKLSKEHIFEEKTSEYAFRTKFAFPSVKPGSVIEFRYELSSPRYWELRDYYFQRAIPVKHSRYYLQIPEYVRFNKEIGGMEFVDVKSSQENTTMLIGSGRHAYTANIYDFVAVDLPGLKEEDYVWNIRDYLSRVSFEIQSFIIPNVIYEVYANTWETVDKKLLENNNFGKQLSHKLFTRELESLFSPEMTNTDKLRAVYKMVKDRVKWNDKNAFLADNPKDALKKGLGSSAEINALLISALREAGFDAYPVAMRKRDLGRIPISHPSMDNFNFFIAAVSTDDKLFYMDASSKYGDLNVMSPTILTDLARSIRGPGLSSWVNLTNISQSSRALAITVGFNEDGLLSGSVKESMGEQLAYALRNAYFQGKDEQEFFDEMAAALDLEITSHAVNNMNMEEIVSNAVQLEYDFVKSDVRLGDEFIYFNPLTIPLYKENPFKAEDRKLPIEFSYPVNQRQIVVLDIPEGYEIEELPKPTKISLGEKDEAVYQYFIANDAENRKVSISIRFSLNKLIYLQAEYAMLRDFFVLLTTNNTQQIVLKKKTQ